MVTSNVLEWLNIHTSLHRQWTKQNNTFASKHVMKFNVNKRILKHNYLHWVFLLTNTFHVMSSFLRESFRLSTSLSCFSSIFVFLWVRIQTKMKPMIPGMKITKLYTALFTALSIPMLSSFWTFLWRREEFDFPRKEFGSLNCQEI